MGRPPPSLDAIATDDAVRAHAAELLQRVSREIVRVLERVPELPVEPRVEPAEIRDHLARYTFEEPLDPEEVVADCVSMLERWTMHTTHPRYFGWFNPSTTLMSVLADALVATFNPQLAVWAKSPAASEIERHVLRALAAHLGLDPDLAAGSFTTGGSESNLTAVVLALTHRFDAFDERGARALPGDPALYLSIEGHSGFEKIAHACGLGRGAVRRVPVDARYALRVDDLRRAIARHRARGDAPFMVVATAGSTVSGAIDPLGDLADLCRDEGLWLHVDAAWGGAAILSRSLAPALAGIERADSVAIDAHKWLSMPLGAGLVLTRHGSLPARAFRVPGTPPADEERPNPYTESLQWSRRFIGLKLFMSLAADGLPGLEARLDRSVALADRLAARLEEEGWATLARSPFPVLCITDATGRFANADERYEAIAKSVNSRGRAWIAATHLGDNEPVLRVCITSFRTTEDDLEVLLEELSQAREALR